MKRLAVFALAFACAAPAFAQSVEADVKAFMTNYIATFNKGDAANLASDFIANPDVPAAKVQADLTAKFEELRKDEFGKMEVYTLKSCSDGSDGAKVQLSYAYMYTYGGVMPPGDQASILDLKKTAGGWRIVKSVDMKPGMKPACTS